MKRLNLFVSLCLIAFALVSCSETLIEERELNLDNQITKVAESLNAPYYVTEDGALCFRSGADFLFTMDSISRLSIDAFRAWEESINFKSCRTVTDNAIYELFVNEELLNYNALLHKYSKLVYADDNGNVYPIMKGQAYRNITNEQGAFYINNIKNIVNGITLSAFDVETNQPVNIGTHTRALGDVLVEYPEKSTAIGDKQVSTSARIYEAMGVGLGGGAGSYSCLVMDVMVRGYSKNVFGVWKKYETQCFVEDVAAYIPGMRYDYSFPETSWSTGDVLIFTKTYFFTTGYAPIPSHEKPECLHYRARTRGTGNYGMAYNFYKGSFVNITNIDPGNRDFDRHDLVGYNK